MSFDVDVTARIGEALVTCRIPPAPGLTVLFGPSGVGKTSVLNMIAGLWRPDHGHVRVSDALLFSSVQRVNVPPERRRAGYVFQDARLFPHLRVRSNLLYGHRKRSSEIEVDDMIALLGLGPLLDRWPRGLSGGEARRVAIGRALLSDPHFLLLDEPLSSLDRGRREEIMGLIERVRDALALTILLVTHDRAEADRLGNRIVEL